MISLSRQINMYLCGFVELELIFTDPFLLFEVSDINRNMERAGYASTSHARKEFWDILSLLAGTS